MFLGVAFCEMFPLSCFPSFLFFFFPFILGGGFQIFLVFCYATFVLSALVLIGKSFFFSYVLGVGKYSGRCLILQSGLLTVPFFFPSCLSSLFPFLFFFYGFLWKSCGCHFVYQSFNRLRCLH